MYQRKIANEIKVVIFTFCSVFSTVCNGTPGICGVDFQTLGAIVGGEAKKGRLGERPKTSDCTLIGIVWFCSVSLSSVYNFSCEKYKDPAFSSKQTQMA